MVLFATRIRPYPRWQWLVNTPVPGRRLNIIRIYASSQIQWSLSTFCERVILGTSILNGPLLRSYKWQNPLQYVGSSSAAPTCWSSSPTRPLVVPLQQHSPIDRFISCFCYVFFLFAFLLFLLYVFLMSKKTKKTKDDSHNWKERKGKKKKKKKTIKPTGGPRTPDLQGICAHDMFTDEPMLPQINTLSVDSTSIFFGFLACFFRK